MTERQDMPQLPSVNHRLVLCGVTGSGKSVAGAWHLFQHTEATNPVPWVVFNPKRDKLLDSIGGEVLELNKPLPKKLPAGRVFVTHPTPETDDDIHVNRLLSEIIQRERVGVYMDEGYSIPKNSKPFRQALTQGRSKQVPIITLTQRPAWLDKFVFTEASMFRCFYLLDTEDRKRVRQNMGIVITDDMPEFFSHWYDVGTRKRFVFSPGPNDDAVREMFLDRNARDVRNSPRWL